MTEPFELSIDDQGRLTLKRPGQEDLVDVRVRRSFPWTTPTRYVSLRNKDNKEVMLIDDLADVPEAVRRTIDGWLSATSFIPKITRVEDVDVRFGFQQWRVQTDRGPADFRVQEREDIRFMPDGRISVKDADGNLYELGKVDQLDEQSRKKIEVLI